MVHHLQYAIRKLLRTPSFAILGILTLAIALGANAAIFSIVDAVLLRPLPFHEAQRLIYVGHTAPGLDLPRMNISPKLYVHYREHAESFESIAMFDGTRVSVTGLDQPLQVIGAELTPSTFPVLRIAPANGRPFTEAEGTPDGEQVMIVSDGFWHRVLGSDPDVLERTLEIDGVARQIVGVMAPDFSFPFPEAEVWLPLVVDPETAPLTSFGTDAVARLAAGADLSQAETELRRFIADLPATFPEEPAAKIIDQAAFDVVLQDFGESQVGDVGPVLWILSATVGFVLLLAAFNVANLFLARAEQRQRETAVRTALGASPRVLAITALFEGWALSLTAAGIGLVLAHFSIDLLKRFGPQNVPRMHEVAVDPRVVAFAVVLSILCGAAFALIPILRARIRDLSLQLKEGGRSSTPGRTAHRTRRLLVAAQMGIAIVLLIGAGLMGRTYLAVMDIEPGFDTEDAFVFQLFLPESRVGQERVAGVYEEILQKIEAVPGVRSAASATEIPLSGSNSSSGHRIEEHPQENDMPIVFGVNTVSPALFETLGIPMVEGRSLTRDDWQQRRPSVVVSKALADHYWPDQSVLGKRLFPGTPSEEDGETWYEIVGVAGNVRVINLTDQPQETVYYSWRMPLEEQDTPRGQALIVRTEVPPEVVADAVRQAVWSVDPDLPVAEIQTLEEIVENASAETAFTALMLLVAASVAVILGAVGTYGVTAYLVAQRTGEIGVRLALGASQKNILRLVLREGVALALAGAVAGLVAAFFLVRGLDSVLFEVEPRDPLTFAMVPALLLLVAAFACLIPAQRASNTDPVVALRHE
ncbi:MAG: ABC transporter permease [Thermoanaerobaculia bacterium]|nr:ABC transporter permease [Thermoanaerobaculia bacterium]